MNTPPIIDKYADLETVEAWLDNTVVAPALQRELTAAIAAERDRRQAEQAERDRAQVTYADNFWPPRQAEAITELEGKAERVAEAVDRVRNPATYAVSPADAVAVFDAVSTALPQHLEQVAERQARLRRLGMSPKVVDPLLARLGKLAQAAQRAQRDLEGLAPRVEAMAAQASRMDRATAASEARTRAAFPALNNYRPQPSTASSTEGVNRG